MIFFQLRRETELGKDSSLSRMSPKNLVRSIAWKSRSSCDVEFERADKTVWRSVKVRAHFLFVGELLRRRQPFIVLSTKGVWHKG